MAIWKAALVKADAANSEDEDAAHSSLEPNGTWYLGTSLAVHSASFRSTTTTGILYNITITS